MNYVTEADKYYSPPFLDFNVLDFHCAVFVELIKSIKKGKTQLRVQFSKDLFCTFIINNVAGLSAVSLNGTVFLTTKLYELQTWANGTEFSISRYKLSSSRHTPELIKAQLGDIQEVLPKTSSELYILSSICNVFGANLGNITVCFESYIKINREIGFGLWYVPEEYNDVY